MGASEVDKVGERNENLVLWGRKEKVRIFVQSSESDSLCSTAYFWALGYHY